MPGKHAPRSPWSFYFSLGRAAGGVIGVVLLVVVLAVVAFGGRGQPKKDVATTKSPTPKATASALPSPTVSPTASPVPAVRAPSAVTVNVLNGNGRTGLASRTGDKIEAAGWNVKDTGNTGRLASVSTIYYQAGFEKEALALQKVFPSFTVVKPATEATSDIKISTMLTCVLGSDWPKGT